MSIAKYKMQFSEYHRGSSSFIHILSKPISESRDPAISHEDSEKLKMATYRSSRNVKTKLAFHGSRRSDKALKLRQLAKRLRRSVCLIDSQQLQNEYIGETEKHLSKLIAQAEPQNWILFFDEADALFGKRSVLKPNRGKFANQQVSYIFKLLSQYKGLSILSVTDNSKLDLMKYSVDNVIIFR